ncbi:hypothetical protein PM082_002533 [Marasmius tenuissimus]|nr:hypothetical protein PM082_002533 [Marasmius tenuissimus]
MVTSAISLTAVMLYTRSRTRFSSGSTQAIIFPAIWSAIWCAVAYVSPVGYLTSWTPVRGVQFYEWLTPFLGPAVRDWTVAAWAVVLSQAIEGWVMDSQTEEETPLISDLPRSSSSSAKDVRPWYGKNWKALGLFLVVLAVPSYVIDNRPLPVISSDSTPFAVACALPPYQRYKNHNPTLQDYKDESRKLVSLADLILWPEGAVSFDSEAERDAAFDDIRNSVQLGDRKWIGVAFDETYADPQDPKGERGIKRTGLALLSNSSQTHLVYYKRHLVPIAESYSMRGSSEPPSVATLELKKPQWYKGPGWGAGPHNSRPVSVTASICLDLAVPGVFSALSSRPALILAPGRTWDATVGEVMWNQAKARAHELGSAILWCDGGDSGISGIAGRGISESIQVGHGSWVRRIALPYPSDDQPTLYGRDGNYFVLILLGLPLVLALPTNMARMFPGGGMRRVLDTVSSWRRRRIEGQDSQEGGNLLE